MNEINIKDFIARFYEAKTTPEEENMLIEYLSSESVSPDLEEDKEIILALLEKQDLDVPKNLRSNIETLLSDANNKKSNNRTIRYTLLIVTAAASLLLFLFPLNNRNVYPDKEQTIKLSAEDREAVRNAVELVADKFEKGTERLASMDSKFEKPSKVYNKFFK